MKYLAFILRMGLLKAQVWTRLMDPFLMDLQLKTCDTCNFKT